MGGENGIFGMGGVRFWKGEMEISTRTKNKVNWTQNKKFKSITQ